MLWITDLCTLILLREGEEMSLLMGGPMRAADPPPDGANGTFPPSVSLSPDAVLQ